MALASPSNASSVTVATPPASPFDAVQDAAELAIARPLTRSPLRWTLASVYRADTPREPLSRLLGACDAWFWRHERRPSSLPHPETGVPGNRDLHPRPCCSGSDIPPVPMSLSSVAQYVGTPTETDLLELDNRLADMTGQQLHASAWDDELWRKKNEGLRLLIAEVRRLRGDQRMSWSARLLASRAKVNIRGAVDLTPEDISEHRCVPTRHNGLDRCPMHGSYPYSAPPSVAKVLPRATAFVPESAEHTTTWKCPIDAYGCHLPGCEICHPKTQQATGNHISSIERVCQCPTCRGRHS